MSSSHPYPQGTVEQLLQTDAVTAATKTAIEPRLHTSEAEPVFFDGDGFGIMKLICNHLMATRGDYPSASIVLEIDTRLAASHSNGWRYQQMPDDRSVYTMALQGINETAEISYNTSFVSLVPENQAAVLHLVQKGLAGGEVWKQLNAALFFEELLTEITEIFYSYPEAQNGIGYVGMADVHGWNRIGLHEQEENEPIDQHKNTGL